MFFGEFFFSFYDWSGKVCQVGPLYTNNDCNYFKTAVILLLFVALNHKE